MIGIQTYIYIYVYIHVKKKLCEFFDDSPAPEFWGGPLPGSYANLLVVLESPEIHETFFTWNPKQPV